MRTIIAGSRHFLDKEQIFSLLNDIRDIDQITEVVCGCAPGVDMIGNVWARKRKLPVKKFKADWRIFGKAAGPIRNQRMADYADRLILIWDGESKGSANMLKEWKLTGKPAATEIIIR